MRAAATCSFLAALGVAQASWAQAPVFVLKWGSLGSGDGQFANPVGVAVDPSGNVYVADEFNNRIQKFDRNGGFLLKWGSLGSGDGQFDSEVGVAVGASGIVYVADAINQRIQKFGSSGGFVLKWGSLGIGDGQFNGPYGVAVDPSGNVYVAAVLSGSAPWGPLQCLS